MAEAAATRPAVVGRTLNEIGSQDPDVLDAVLQVMEIDHLLKSGAALDVLPRGASLIVSLESPLSESAGQAGATARLPSLRR
jgi:hypothetical protein